MQDERRREPRHANSDRVVATIHEPGMGRDRQGKTIACTTVDISNHGTRLLVDREVPRGSNLNLWVKRLDGPGTLSLEGEVRWCRPADDGFWVGVELQDVSEANLVVWQSMLAALRPS